MRPVALSRWHDYIYIVWRRPTRFKRALALGDRINASLALYSSVIRPGKFVFLSGISEDDIVIDRTELNDSYITGCYLQLRFSSLYMRERNARSIILVASQYIYKLAYMNYLTELPFLPHFSLQHPFAFPLQPSAATCRFVRV